MYVCVFSSEEAFLIAPFLSVVKIESHTTYLIKNAIMHLHYTVLNSAFATHTQKAGQAVLQHENVMAHKEQSAPFLSANCGIVRYEMNPYYPPPTLASIYCNYELQRNCSCNQAIHTSVIATSQMQSETQ